MEVIQPALRVLATALLCISNRYIVTSKMRLLCTAWLAALVVVAKPPEHPILTAEDMLAAPRPQAPIVGPNGKIAISVVDHWDPKTDR